MMTVHNLEEEQVKALTKYIGVSYTACAATAGTTLVIGYSFGIVHCCVYSDLQRECYDLALDSRISSRLQVFAMLTLACFCHLCLSCTITSIKVRKFSYTLNLSHCRQQLCSKMASSGIQVVPSSLFLDYLLFTSFKQFNLYNLLSTFFV